MIYIQKNISNQTTQRGATLVIVIVVLLALTLLGLAATDSGNLQKVMVRNNQLRLEAFNTSATEIQAQIDFYGIDNSPIFQAIDTGVRLGTNVTDGGGNPTLDIESVNQQFQKTVGLLYTGGCQIIGNTLGTLKCNQLMIDSDSRYLNTNIGSDQRQTFTFLTLE